MFTALLKVEHIATVKPPKISEVNGAEASVSKTRLRQQSSIHKASYEAALAKANAASTTSVCEMALVSGKASSLVKLFEGKAKSTMPSIKKGPPTATSQTVCSKVV